MSRSRATDHAIARTAERRHSEDFRRGRERMSAQRPMEFNEDGDELRVTVWVRCRKIQLTGAWGVLGLLATIAIAFLCLIVEIPPEAFIALILIVAAALAFMRHVASLMTTSPIIVIARAEQLTI